MIIYCDSSTREACLVLEGREIEELGRIKIIPYPKQVTNNVGEYRAVELAIEEAIARQLKEVKILSDSLLVVNQVNGIFKCKSKYLLPLRDRVINILTKNKELIIRIEWTPREENLAGKILG